MSKIGCNILFVLSLMKTGGSLVVLLIQIKLYIPDVIMFGDGIRSFRLKKNWQGSSSVETNVYGCIWLMTDDQIMRWQTPMPNAPNTAVNISDGTRWCVRTIWEKPSPQIIINKGLANNIICLCENIEPYLSTFSCNLCFWVIKKSIVFLFLSHQIWII